MSDKAFGSCYVEAQNGDTKGGMPTESSRVCKFILGGLRTFDHGVGYETGFESARVLGGQSFHVYVLKCVAGINGSAGQTLSVSMSQSLQPLDFARRLWVGCGYQVIEQFVAERHFSGRGMGRPSRPKDIARVLRAG